MQIVEFRFQLPEWTNALVQASGSQFDSEDARMRFVVELSRRNVRFGTGGPFGAAVFEADGHLLAAGVNCVVPSRCSILHAEMVALALAQQRIGCFDLSEGGRFRRTLFASTEPCAMCFGAVPWSGVCALVCGARDEDARSVGFDEGPKLADWPAQLEKRGISVTRDVLRSEAAAVLAEYAACGAQIYNPGKSGL
jgi:tRNA(Arg) A34 adenosine deaminase TadA